MGCCYSRLEREEIVSRSKARRRYMNQLVRSRNDFAIAHTCYVRSLRSTGSALLQFATSEQTHHRQPPPPSLPSPPPPPPMSPGSDHWTSRSASPALPPPPPPPPPPPSSWDFWDPFGASSSKSVTEEDWDGATTVSGGVAVANPVRSTVNDGSLMAPPSVTSGYSKDTGELAMVVSRNSKDLVQIIKELDEYFLKAADGGHLVSVILEEPSPGFHHSNQKTTTKVYHSGRRLSPLLWSWSMDSKPAGFSDLERYTEEINGNGNSVNGSHYSTVERLYAWEKKLYQEVKNGESIKKEHEKRVVLLRNQEARGVDYVKIEKNKKEIGRLSSRMVVACQAIETTSAEITRLRESELYPQLIELIKGLMFMWRSMYECHQVQTHIVQQLKFLDNIVPVTEPTTNFHRQSTLQLELEVQQWHSAFCNLVQSHRDYIHSLTGWLRLSLFQFNFNKTQQNPSSKIYSLCEEWQLVLDRIPDKVASEGIKSFITVTHAVVLQQAEELKQKKRSEAMFKELENNLAKLRRLEYKYGPYSGNAGSSGMKSPVAEKAAKVEALKARAEEEKGKHTKCVSVTRAMTLNNLQTGFPNVFQAMTGFASVCMQAFESVYNNSQAKNLEEGGHGLKKLLN